MPSVVGNVLMALTDGGMQHLLAGARADVGVKSGRYMFEVKIVEFVAPLTDQSQAWNAKNSQVVRVGFSSAGSSLILGETADGVAFELDGNFLNNRDRTTGGTAFGRDDVMGVLLNLEEKHPNHGTVSLFKDGVRASPPIALPETLKGKALFPHVTYRNVSLHVNFSPAQLAPLPFKARMLQDALQKDVEVRSYSKPKDGRYEVMVPVGLPHEGAYEWLDGFLAKNPEYTELSDRALFDWADKSMTWRSKPSVLKASLDKPEMSFGIRELDDGITVRKIVRQVATLQARNYVLMEVRSNLLTEERQQVLAQFPAGSFKRVAQVVVGEPPQDFKQRTWDFTLKQKQENANKEHQVELNKERQKRVLARQQKERERLRLKAERQAERARKKAEEIVRRRQAEAEKKKAELEAAKAEKEAGEDAENQPEGATPSAEAVEAPGESKEEAPSAGDACDGDEDEDKDEPEEEEPEPKEEPAPKVALSEEEKKTWFKSGGVPDVNPSVLASTFMKFSLPAKDEGFDDVRYEWHKGQKAEEYLKKWILSKKLTSRMEDLQPSEWFQKKWAEWNSSVAHWHNKQSEFRTAVAKKVQEKAWRENQRARAEALKKAQAEAKAKAKEERRAARAAAAKAAAESASTEAAEKKEGDDSAKETADAAEEKKIQSDSESEKEQEEKEEAPAQAEGEEEEGKKVDFDELDVFGVKDVADLGDGGPLCREFQGEDWTLMGLVFELHFLTHAFRRDANDPDRTGVPLELLPYYYNKYFKKQLSFQAFGVDSFKALCELAEDSVYLADQHIVQSCLDGDMESPQVFPKIVEEARRARRLRINLGEEEAKLKFQGAQQSQQSYGNGNYGGWGGGGYRGGGKGGWGPYQGGKGGSYGGGNSYQQRYGKQSYGPQQGYAQAAGASEQARSWT